MTLRSMTTYARVEEIQGNWRISLELRSVNGRFCDVNLRMPRFLMPLEDRIRRRVQKVLMRGRVDVGIQMDGGPESSPEFVPNLPLTKAYLNAVKELGQGLGLDTSIDLSTVLSIVRDAIVSRDPDRDYDAIWDVLSLALERLLADAIDMGQEEGKALVSDLELHINRVRELVDSVDVRRQVHLEEAQKALFKRIEDMLSKCGQLDPQRIHQEAAILADRLDITEEITRARSHLDQFENVVAGDPPAGRRLDFLLQEIFREVNTMASKSSDDRISQMVVEIKGELEILREQVQNLV